MPRSQDRIFLFADDFNVADACAHQFYADAIARLQTLEPTVTLPSSPSSGRTVATIPYQVISFVAKVSAFTSGALSVVDLLELESRIQAKNDSRSIAIFEPEDYPGLVWLDRSDGTPDSIPTEDISMGETPSVDISFETKTIVFPSGAILVHGSSMEKMEESMKKKMPIIHKCLRDAPASIESSLRPSTT